METNRCDVNHLGSDVLLPPRKRLLAGFKKQTSDGNGSRNPPPPAIASSSLNASAASSEVQTHLNSLLASHLNNPNLTPEEIAEASRSAAAAAVKAAKAARAVADEKAAIAAKAVAAAKSALDLVASFSEEVACRERTCLKKNKLKKHVPVELLYTKEDQLRENHNRAERRLHQAINSSPRILRACSSSEGKGHKHKKHKNSVTSENSRFSYGGSIVLEETPHSICNGHDISARLDSDNSSDGINSTKADEKEPVYEKSVRLELDNKGAESSHLKEKSGEEKEINSSGKKRGRVKLKKLPLSICASRDQVNPKEEGIAKSFSSPLAEKNAGDASNSNKPLFQPEGSKGGATIPVMAGPSWKCQDLKAPECVKQNKAVHS